MMSYWTEEYGVVDNKYNYTYVLYECVDIWPNSSSFKVIHQGLKNPTSAYS